MRIPAYIGYPLLAAVAYGALYLFANGQVYHPMRYPNGWWEVQNELGAEDVWLDVEGGVRIHGWWAPVEAARCATLYLHGNAGNISHRGSHVREINAAGSSILLIDYRGYGKSDGRPSEKGLYADAMAGYQFLREKGYFPNRIVVHGESLGTSVAVDLAARVPVGGVILEAPFTSASDVAGRVLPLLGSLLVRGFNTRSKIARIDAPLLLIHGESDEIIPFDMGQALFIAASEPKSLWSIPDAGHNDIVEVAGPAYARRLKQFYDALPTG